MAAASCTLSYTDNAQVSMRILAKSIKSNAIAMVLSILVIFVCIVMLFVVLNMVFKLIKQHMRFAKKSTYGTTDVVSDDIKYTGGKRIHLPVEPEALRVRAKMAEISALYDPYNRAVSDYAMRVKGEASPDDLINERILSRKHDDFKYTGTSAKDTPFPETEQRVFHTR